MEFPELGERCAAESCQQLDFLPFSCRSCNRVFCLEHKDKEIHGCRNDIHSKDDTQPLESHSYQCSLIECQITELVPVKCHECLKNFCMKHRHQQDHKCEKIENRNEAEVTPKEKIESIIGRELKVQSKEPKKGKKSKTAAKVALMKLKMHASGDKGIPQTEREYFNIETPSPDDGKTNETIPMYFSKKWTIGRIIDFIAASKGIPNKNNVAGEKKLQLLNMDDIIVDPSESLENSLTKGIIDLDDRFLKLSYSSQR